MVGDDIDE
ncbi:hypothetical protein YPPY94_2399, partial [Yersinia pestis PY-94]